MNKAFAPFFLAAGLAGLLLAAGGCSMLRNDTAKTEAAFRSLAGKGNGPTTPQGLALLQIEAGRAADQYVAMVAQACDDFSAKATNAQDRLAALDWKLSQARAAYLNATGPNPALNAVDMVVLASVSRMVVKDYWVGERPGDSALPLLEVQSRIETNTWELARQALTPKQRDELQNVIQEWRRNNPGQRRVEAARLSDLVKLTQRAATAAERDGSTGLLGLSMIDPLSGLDPAVRAVEQTRQLAERAMYFAERVPRLVSWQIELLTLQLSLQPDSKQVLSDLRRLTQSTEVFAKTAEQLPKLVNDQREAAINQLFAGVAVERSNILAGLVLEEAKVRDLLAETRSTLNAGGEMATSVNGAIKSLDTFVRYVSPPDTNPPPVSTNSPPFNVLDYGKAAGQVGGMARDLTGLLTSVNQSVPRLEQLVGGVEANGQRLVHRAFWLGLVLVVVFLAGALAAALAYRKLAPKPPPNGPGQVAPSVQVESATSGQAGGLER